MVMMPVNRLRGLDFKRRAPFLSLDVTGYVVVVVVVVFVVVVLIIAVVVLVVVFVVAERACVSVRVSVGLSVCPLDLFVHLYA